MVPIPKSNQLETSRTTAVGISKRSGSLSSAKYNRSLKAALPAVVAVVEIVEVATIRLDLGRLPRTQPRVRLRN